MVQKIISTAIVAGFISIVQADAVTNTTQRYLKGELESHLVEIGIDHDQPVTSKTRKRPEWRKTQEEGIKLHCSRTLRALIQPGEAKCGFRTNVKSVLN